MNWRSFSEAAPDLAAMAERKFEESGLCLIGTLRRDGWPRISPVEPYVVEGELLLGMMWQSQKAIDLLRDPRVVVHTTQCDREAAGGDVKLYGHARELADKEWKTRYGDATQARIDWRPDGPFHLFAVDVETAGFISFGDEARVLRWSARRGVQEIPHPDE